MEFILYLIGLIFGLNEPNVTPVAVEMPKIEAVATTTPIKKVTFSFTKSTRPVTSVKATSTPIVTPIATGTEPILELTTTSAPTEPVIIVSQPVIEYNVTTTQITPKKMEVTISEPTFELNTKPNSSKYLGTFTVSDPTKEVIFTYEEISPMPKYTKGGMEYRANQPYEIYWERAGTFSYKINYNNGEVTKEGIFTVTE